MTSPDHYRSAEHFAEEAYNAFRHDDEAGATALAAIGQVHATLALAEAMGGDAGGWGRSGPPVPGPGRPEPPEHPSRHPGELPRTESAAPARLAQRPNVPNPKPRK